MSRRAAAIASLIVVTALFGAAIALRERFNPWWTNATAAAVSTLLAMLVMRGRLAPLLRVSWVGISIAAATGAAMVTATHVVYQLAIRVAPSLETSVNALYADIAASSPGLAIVIPLTAFVVFAEELVWRGVVFELLGAKLRRALVVLVSVALYAVPQLIGQTWILIAAAIVAGLIFAIVRSVSGRLIEPLIVHGMWSIAIFSVLPLT